LKDDSVIKERSIERKNLPPDIHRSGLLDRGHSLVVRSNICKAKNRVGWVLLIWNIWILLYWVSY